MKQVGLIGLILNLLVVQIRSQTQNALREECRVLGCGNCRDLADLGQTICCQGKDNIQYECTIFKLDHPANFEILSAMHEKNFK